jgi:hypothetical protein
LEKKIIEDSLERMKFADEKTWLINKMQEMKNKFNDMLNSKAEL